MSVDMAIRVLDESVGKIVLIKLKGGKIIRGILQGFDQHMNLVLKESEEIFEDKSNSIGTIVVRGDNVVIISPPPT
jgi:small nuclear ribonucleoprotein